MFERLKEFKAIAWDFDDTLVNHPKSALFWDYIERNPHGQIHHIITMRSHGLQYTMFEELEDHGSPLTRGHFERVINVPNSLFEQYERARRNSIVLHNDHDYFLFKGEQCREIGADVLIDDMEEVGLSHRGCEVHGILHIHPDQL